MATVAPTTDAVATDTAATTTPATTTPAPAADATTTPATDAAEPAIGVKREAEDGAESDNKKPKTDAPAASDAPAAGGLSGLEIVKMVNDREKCRATKDWDTADQIREQLRGHGVELFDKEKEWRHSDGRRGAIMLGPGTGVTMSACALTDEQIMAKITDREAARQEKDWARGDVIRDELRAAGCEINDKDKSWRTTEGRKGRVGAVMEGNNIQQIIDERQQARDMKDWARADQLREQLRAQGVQVHDKEGIWNSNDGRTGLLSASHDQGPLMDSQIHALIAQREQARAVKDWATGDQIRDMLRGRGVDIHDKEKYWRAQDGRQGYIGNVNQMGGGMQQHMGGYHQQQQMQQQHGLASLGGVQYTPQQQQAYMPQQAVGYHLQAQQQQQQVHAYQQQQQAYAQAQMSQMGQMGQMGGGGGQACALTDPEIVAYVQQRETARQGKDWASADQIRDVLRQQGVNLDDRAKTWRTGDGRQGMIGNWSR